MEWNHKNWISNWQKAITVPQSNRRRHTAPLLIDVYKDTVSRVQKGGYYLNEKWVDLNLNPLIETQTIFYNSPIEPIQTNQRDKANELSVLGVDCLALARDIVFSRPDLQVCVLNLASYVGPGGGVHSGAGAQEEYLFRCSDYYRSLYQYGNYSTEYGVNPHPEHRYPLDERYGAVFSRDVTIFRDTQAEGYRLLGTPYKVNMLAIAAHRNPRTIISAEGEVRYTPAEAEYMTHKARTILRIAHANGQNALVLGALGCGAFHNPPKHVAEIFKSVINEPEFSGLFDYIYFAVINDHNSNGNFEAFDKVLNSSEELTDKERISEILRRTGRKGLDKVLCDLERINFYDAPGSVVHHSNYRGGLAEHSLKVYEHAMTLKKADTENYGNISDTSIAIVALLHDLCKADVYFIKTDGTPDKSMRKFPIGHGEKSVIMLLRLGLELTEEEMLAIRWHMGEHTLKDKGLELDNYKAALKSPAASLIKLIQKADGKAAHEAKKEVITYRI